ncbi:MAG: DUF3592 domain-containing protein [Verrucomicrobiota bacterium]
MKIIFALIFVLVGGGLIALGIVRLKGAQESKSWPSTSGQITELSIKQGRKSGKKENSFNSKRTYQPVVNYRYQVGDEAFTGNRVTYEPLSRSSSRVRAERVISAFTEGQTVTVFYDPDAPEKSVLQTGRTFQAYIIPVFGGVFLLVGLMMLFKRGVPEAS